MKARKTTGKAKTKAGTKKPAAKRTGAVKTAAKAKTPTTSKKTPATTKATPAASDKYRQPGAPWWKAHI